MKTHSIVEYNATLKYVNENTGAMLNIIEDYITNYLRDTFNIEYKKDVNFDIKLNGRLKNVAGRIRFRQENGTDYVKPLALEVSKAVIVHSLLENDYDMLFGVLNHEMVHVALHHKGQPFRDIDTFFQETCIRLNVPLSVSTIRPYHMYECDNGHTIYRHRKLKYVDNYKCSCGSRLTYIGEKVA